MRRYWQKLALNGGQHRLIAEAAEKLYQDQLDKYANLVTPKTLLI